MSESLHSANPKIISRVLNSPGESWISLPAKSLIYGSGLSHRGTPVVYALGQSLNEDELYLVGAFRDDECVPTPNRPLGVHGIWHIFDLLKRKSP